VVFKVRAQTLGAALLCVTTVAPAQDLTLPPRLEESPGDVRLAEPPDDRRRALEEVIAINQSEWRLPDLGSAWRVRNEDERETGRIVASLLPIYDPEAEHSNFDPLRINPQVRQVGFIELFRIRFGRRSRD
jgi:hypothetical protein